MTDKKIYLPEHVHTALSMLEASGEAGYIVGGCVRDALMGTQPADYDITTSALPERTKEIFEGYTVIETGIKHGTVTVLIGGTPLEITTYRTEVGYSDGRHPDAVHFTRALRDDLSRRDFTMNALAYNDKEGIVDLYDGASDIRRGIIRCVGDPSERFTEDALRIMRALRFASRLGFEIDGDSAEAIHRLAPTLTRVSAERLASELRGLLCGEHVRRILTEYVDVLGVFIPELLPMKEFDQRNRHHIYDVLEHTARAVESVRPVPVLRLAALFHDTGKPPCFTLDEHGEGHFKGHPEVSAEITAAVMSRLKFDTATKELVTRLVKYHDRQIEPTERAVRRALAKLSPEVFDLLLELKRADNLAQAPEYLGRQAEYDKLEKIARGILERKECIGKASLAVNGKDLIAIGITDGPTIGRVLDTLLCRVIDGELENERDILLEASKTITKFE